MKLMYEDQVVGEIEGASVEGAWSLGSISLTPFGMSLENLFKYVTQESEAATPLSFDQGLLDETRWWISDDGQRRSISVPAVYMDDNSIYWRWA